MTDFAHAEFADRTAKAQKAMRAEGFDALLLCAEAEVRYFTGFRTPFWQSPTRPWFLVLPARGAPVAVIPAIGAELMARTWVNDIRTWASPAPDDEGILLLANALRGARRIGLPMGPETHLRMPLSDFEKLRQATASEFADCAGIVRSLRMVKTPAEAAVIAEICDIASRSFARAGELFAPGQSLAHAFRDFRIALLQEGADEVPYLVGAAGAKGYGDVISPPTGAPLQAGDVLMLDTGSTLKGYFCDFDRNFALGRADPAVADCHRLLWEATEAGLAAARPGATAADLFAAMDRVIDAGSDVGRYGHGLGMQLTEWPSLAAFDDTVITEGMVLTLEPSAPVSGGGMMVTEENILITADGPRLLSARAERDIPVIGGAA